MSDIFSIPPLQVGVITALGGNEVAITVAVWKLVSVAHGCVHLSVWCVDAWIQGTFGCVEGCRCLEELLLK